MTTPRVGCDLRGRTSLSRKFPAWQATARKFNPSRVGRPVRPSPTPTCTPAAISPKVSPGRPSQSARPASSPQPKSAPTQHRTATPARSKALSTTVSSHLSLAGTRTIPQPVDRSPVHPQTRETASNPGCMSLSAKAERQLLRRRRPSPPTGPGPLRRSAGVTSRHGQRGRGDAQAQSAALGGDHAGPAGFVLANPWLSSFLTQAGRGAGESRRARSISRKPGEAGPPSYSPPAAAKWFRHRRPPRRPSARRKAA